MALKMHPSLAVHPGDWLRMQVRYDLARAHDIVDDEPIRAYG